MPGFHIPPYAAITSGGTPYEAKMASRPPAPALPSFAIHVFLLAWLDLEVRFSPSHPLTYFTSAIGNSM
jgi:hypothetical protein